MWSQKDQGGKGGEGSPNLDEQHCPLRHFREDGKGRGLGGKEEEERDGGGLKKGEHTPASF